MSGRTTRNRSSVEASRRAGPSAGIFLDDHPRLSETGETFAKDKLLIDYLTEHILSRESSKWTIKQSLEMRRHLQRWPLKLDLHHDAVQSTVRHLSQLESHDRLDTGTSIEIQNRLNQLARLGHYSNPFIQSIVNGLSNSTGN